jgi:hypothetical protein
MYRKDYGDDDDDDDGEDYDDGNDVHLDPCLLPATD